MSTHNIEHQPRIPSVAIRKMAPLEIEPKTSEKLASLLYFFFHYSSSINDSVSFSLVTSRTKHLS